MSKESGHLTIGEVRRSLSFNESSLAEEEPITNEKAISMQAQKEHISAEDQLKNDCDKLWQELNDTHARLETSTLSRLHEEDTSDFEGPKVLEKVLNAKEKKLQTEIIALEKEGLQVTSANPECTVACLKSQLLKSINQLEETLKIVKGQRKEIEQDLQREEEILKQHQEIDESLTAKIASLEQARDAVNSASQTKDLEKQNEAADVYLLRTMKKLGSFLSANFPLPHPDDFKGTKNQGIGVSMDPNVAYVSLQQLTEDLMNMLYIKPSNPYIRIEQIHWPPYIELLLRCGVALRHPQDCNLIRLVAFNR